MMKCDLNLSSGRDPVPRTFAAAWVEVPKLLCLVARARLPLLLSFANHGAVMDWMIGTAVAWLPIRARIQPCRAIPFRSIQPASRNC